MSMDMMCIARPEDGVFARVNPAMCHGLGYSEDELLNHPFIEFIHPDDVQRTLDEVKHLVDGGITLNFENRYRKKDGDYAWLSWTARPSADGRTFCVARDVTEQKQRIDREREMLTKAATIDPLTDLYNRRGAESALARIVDGAGVILVDVDDFKAINDTCGHKAGDSVLQDLATRIRISVRPSDVVCRVGGDEFLVVLPNADERCLRCIAERVRKNVSKITVKSKKGAQVQVTASVGVSHSVIEGSTVSSIMKDAALAMQNSKRKGKNRVSSASQLRAITKEDIAKHLAKKDGHESSS